MSSNVDVSIITVNYYSINEITECFESVKKITSGLITYEFIVISNSDETVQELEKLNSKFTNLKYIISKTNVGFGLANNLGVKESSGRYLFFLNPDTKILNDCLNKLKSFLENNTHVGIVGPAIYSEDNTVQPSINNYPSKITMLSFVLPFAHIILPKKYIFRNYSLENTSVVPVVQGSSIFISRSLFKKVGGFSKEYFLYSEETDLCKRVLNTGKKTAYFTDAKILHIGGVTTSSNFDLLTIEMHKSKRKYIELHNPELVFFNRATFSLGYLLRFIFSILTLNIKKTKFFFRLMSWYFFKYS
ncbi:MAG: hypothetical protein BalsKO_25890 [Balneolaceae bacterium]